jgi:hypothetical protein
MVKIEPTTPPAQAANNTIRTRIDLFITPQFLVQQIYTPES